MSSVRISEVIVSSGYLILIPLNVAILLISLYLFLKIRVVLQRFNRVHEHFTRVDRNINSVFGQAEALFGLYTDLRFEKSLPATRGWAASPDFLREISEYVLTKKPQVVVECSSGVSTVVLAKSLERNGEGHVYSLEHEANYAAKTRANLDKHGLRKWATVIDAPLKEIKLGVKKWRWYGIDKLPDRSIDMLVIDGPPESAGKLARYPAGPMLFKRLKEDGTIFLDDAIREDERMAVTLWIQEDSSLHCDLRNAEKGFAILWRQKDEAERNHENT